MGRKLHPLILKEAEITELQQMLSSGRHSSREIIRAQVLLKLHAGSKPTAIAQEVFVQPATVASIKRRYLSEGLERALKDAPRSGAPVKITEFHEADVTVLACSTPPEGYGKWTVELLSDQMVQLGYQEGVSPSSIRRVLKKVNSSPGNKSFGALER
jgi:putative transposase